MKVSSVVPGCERCSPMLNKTKIECHPAFPSLIFYDVTAVFKIDNFSGDIPSVSFLWLMELLMIHRDFDVKNVRCSRRYSLSSRLYGEWSGAPRTASAVIYGEKHLVRHDTETGN